MAKVKIARGIQQNYNAIPVKDGDTIYVCTDSGNIYVGDTLVFEPNAYIGVSISGKIVTFTTHGANGTSGYDTLDLSMFQTGSEVAQAISVAIASIPEYTIERLPVADEGYSSSYILKKGNSQVGATINIPKDMVVSNGEVKTVTTANVPYQGAQVGDKYIDLTIANTAQNHIYIPVKDLVDVYLAGNGIEISANNYISVKIDQNNSNGLGVGGSGVAMYVVTPSVNGVGGSNGAMLATDKEKLDGLDIGNSQVYLNGYVSSHSLGPGDLFAFGIPEGEGTPMYITPFRYGLPNVVNVNWIPVTDYSFPIGCKIYYNPNYLSTPNVEVVSGLFYSSFKKVSVYNNSITPSTVNLGVANHSAVFLRVSVEGNRWKPFYRDGSVVEFLVSSSQLYMGNFYIYLGRTIGENSVENIKWFQLEDNNPLYYFDGKGLIDWASYQKSVVYAQVLNDLSNYYTTSETYSQDEIDSLLNDMADFEYVVVESPNELPVASDKTMGKMYLFKEHRYVTIYDSSLQTPYYWYDLGSYNIDLTGYVTTDDLDDALEDRPIFQLVTEAQMQNLIDNETWEEGVIYYSVED